MELLNLEQLLLELSLFFCSFAMDAERAVNKTLRDLKFQGLIEPNNAGNIRPFLHRLWVIGWEARGKELVYKRTNLVSCYRQGKKIGVFHDIQEAHRKMKCARNSIYRSLNTGQPTRSGLLWKYEKSLE